jgi:hypothetical protein
VLRTARSGNKLVEYIEVELTDIALANELAHEVLGRSLDELPPQTRRVLGMIEAWVESEAQRRSLLRGDVRFTRRELRQRCGLSNAAIRVHLERLVAMEYVRAAAGRNGQRFEYELLFDGEVDRSAPQMIGLIDVAALRVGGVDTTATSQGETPGLAPGLQAARGPLAPTLRDNEITENTGVAATSHAVTTESVENASRHSIAINGRSVGQARPAPASSSNSLSLAAVPSGG